MSDYTDSLNKKVSMCPCTCPKDVPQGPQQMTESSDENDMVENQNGYETFSGESAGSDEEQDTLASQGYVLLAQNEGESTLPNETEIEYVNSVVTNDVNSSPEQCEIILKPELSNAETGETSTSAFSSTSRPTMTEDEIDLIKSVMSNVKLPTSSIPEWAKRIPEEKWIAPFVSSLPNRDTGEVTISPEEKFQLS